MQAQVQPGGRPGRGEDLAVVGVEHVGLDARPPASGGPARRRASSGWPPARPSSSPAAARVNAPVQIEAIRAPAVVAPRAAPPSSVRRRFVLDARRRPGRSPCPPRCSSASPDGPSNSRPSAVRTGPSCDRRTAAPHTTRARGSPAGCRRRPRTAAASSNIGRPGVTAIATRCMAGFYSRLSFLPLVAAALGPQIDADMPDLTARDLRRRALSWIALGVVYVVWGSTYLAIRVGVGHLPPLLMAGARYVIAGALLYPVALRGGGRPSRQRPGQAPGAARCSGVAGRRRCRRAACCSRATAACRSRRRGCPRASLPCSWRRSRCGSSSSPGSCRGSAVSVEVRCCPGRGAGRRGGPGRRRDSGRTRHRRDHPARRGGRLGTGIGAEPPAGPAGPRHARRGHRDAGRRGGPAGRGRRHRGSSPASHWSVGSRDILGRAGLPDRPRLDPGLHRLRLRPGPPAA